MRPRLLPWFLVAVLAASCSGPDDPRPAEPAESAQQVWQDALAALQDDEERWFTVTIVARGRVLAWSGGVSTDDGWRAQIILSPRDGGPDQVADAVSTGGTVWVKEREPRRCWVPLSDTQVPGGFFALRPGDPSYVSIVDVLSVSGSDDPAVLRGTVPLVDGLRLWPGWLLEHADGASEARGAIRGATVDVEVRLRKRQVGTMKMTGADLLAAWESTGARISDPEARAALAATSVSIDVRPRPEPSSISAPRPDEVATDEHGRDCVSPAAP